MLDVNCQCMSVEVSGKRGLIMKFYKPKSLLELFEISEKIERKKYFLAGGTDINIQIKNGIIKDESIIFLNHLSELKGILKSNNHIIIGALTNIREILESKLLKDKLPFFQNSLLQFASPLIQTTATIGGNIANGSPTADVVPLLLVLDAKLKLFSKSKLREVPISEFYTGYKKFILKRNEIIGAVLIPENAETGYETFYQKVGSRKALYIAKLAIAGLKKISNNIIEDIKLAVGSLNEYPRRLYKVEEYLKDKPVNEIDFSELENQLKKEITPITDLRSDKGYRYQVCVNLIRTFLNH